MKSFYVLLLSLLLSFFIVKAQSGNALHFDGANDQVVATVPSLFSNLTANSFTMEAWVYPTGAIFSRIIYAQSATNSFATMSTGGTNNIYFYVVANGTNYSAATTATLPSNQWTHVAARWTAGTNAVAVFFNGVLQASSPGGSSSTGTSGLLTLGTRPGGAQYFPGAIDEVRIWSTARTQCEIQSNMNRHFTGPQTNLVAYYDFNHGTAGGNNAGVTTLSDYSGNANNGTLSNFALTGTTSNWIASTVNITSNGNATGGYNITANASVCLGASYTFPNGSTQSNITAQVVQTSTLTATNGCDSVIVTTVDVNQTYNVQDSAWVCSGGSYTFPDGSTQSNITAQVVQTSNLQTLAGCDSVIVTTVDVLPSYNLTQSAIVCSGGSYLFPDSSLDTNITVQVVHTSTLQTLAGCDSIIVTTVDVTPNYFYFVLDTVCNGGNYTFPDGSVQSNITTQVSHISAFQTIAGCDSSINTTVDVFVVDTAVSVAAITLTASATGATYQWIDCTTGFPISGEVNSSFTPTTSGNYAVVVTENGCSDTSSCYAVTVVGVGNGPAPSIALYPNPNKGSFVLELPATLTGLVKVEVRNAVGQIVWESMLGAGKQNLNLGTVANGVYTLKVHGTDGIAAMRVVVNR